MPPSRREDCGGSWFEALRFGLALAGPGNACRRISPTPVAATLIGVDRWSAALSRRNALELYVARHRHGQVGPRLRRRTQPATPSPPTITGGPEPPASMSYRERMLSHGDDRLLLPMEEMPCPRHYLPQGIKLYGRIVEGLKLIHRPYYGKVVIISQTTTCDDAILPDIWDQLRRPLL